MKITTLILTILTLLTLACGTGFGLSQEEEVVQHQYTFENLYEIENFKRSGGSIDAVESYLKEAQKEGYHLYQIQSDNVGRSTASNMIVVVKRNPLPDAPDRETLLKTIENGIKQDVEHLGSYVYDDELVWACQVISEVDYKFNRDRMELLKQLSNELQGTEDIAGISGVYAAMSIMRGLYYGEQEVIQNYCEIKLRYDTAELGVN